MSRPPNWDLMVSNMRWIRNLADIRLDHQRRRTSLFEEASGVFGGRVVLLVVDCNSFHPLLSELQRDSAANTARCPCDQSGLLRERDWHDTLPFASTDRRD